MKIHDQLSLALRMFKTRPMRTALTVLGVGVGIGTVLFLVSLGYGLQQTILNRIASADTLLTLDVSAGSEKYALTANAVAAIGKLPHVTELSRLSNLPAQATEGALTSDSHVMLIDPSFFRLSGLKTEQGKAFEDGEKPTAVISSAGVLLFGLKPETIIGKKIMLLFSINSSTGSGKTAVTKEIVESGSYVVSGVVSDDSASYIYLPLSAIPASVIPRFDLVKVKVESSNNLEPVRTAILNQGFVVSAVSDTIDQAKNIFHIVQIILGLFGLVALIVSAIGMFNTMTITLLERTNEIGIMRAIGITKKDIRSIFLVESMVMGFLGGLGGMTMGMTAGFVVNWGMNILAARFHGPVVSLFYTPPWFIMVILIFSTVIGFLTGVYPSVRASRLNPLDALRYK